MVRLAGGYSESGLAGGPTSWWLFGASRWFDRAGLGNGKGTEEGRIFAPVIPAPRHSLSSLPFCLSLYL